MSSEHVGQVSYVQMYSCDNCVELVLFFVVYVTDKTVVQTLSNLQIID